MGPLQGLKVVDLTSMVSGPCGGNDACRSGRRGGQLSRRRGTNAFLGPPTNELPAAFFSCNRGKTSLALDLKAEARARSFVEVDR